MRTYLLLCLGIAALLSSISCKQSTVSNTLPRLPTLTPLWTTSNLPMPESVVMVKAESQYLLVSLIDGDPTQQDGKGGIAQIGLDGNIINREWYKGLNAPKGMALSGNELWVSDIDRLLVIDINSRKLLRQIAISGAQFLNDVAIDAQGRVYVSDTFTHTVYRLQQGDLAIYAQNIQAANGLLPQKDGLLIAANDKLLHIDHNKKIRTITQQLFPEADGIQPWKDNSYLLTSWKGMLYLVDLHNTHLLWNAQAENNYTADILVDSETSLLVVPGLFNNTLRAYRLNYLQ